MQTSTKTDTQLPMQPPTPLPDNASVKMFDMNPTPNNKNL